MIYWAIIDAFFAGNKFVSCRIPGCLYWRILHTPAKCSGSITICKQVSINCSTSSPAWTKKHMCEKNLLHAPSLVFYIPSSLFALACVSHAEMKSMHRIGTEISKFDLFQIVDREYIVWKPFVFFLAVVVNVRACFVRCAWARELCKTHFSMFWNHAERYGWSCICALWKIVQPTNSIHINNSTSNHNSRTINDIQQTVTMA